MKTLTLPLGKGQGKKVWSLGYINISEVGLKLSLSGLKLSLSGLTHSLEGLILCQVGFTLSLDVEIIPSLEFLGTSPH